MKKKNDLLKVLNENDPLNESNDFSIYYGDMPQNKMIRLGHLVT